MPEWVFGYGSLASPTEAHVVSDLGPPQEAELEGYARMWNIAMWNPDPVNDPKYYVDPDSGDRPSIHVVFLNVVPTGGEGCNGVVIPVDHSTLADFDVREVNYERVEVTEAIVPRVEGKVWTYVGIPAAHERFQAGMAAGNAYISREYFAYCEAAFRARGAAQFERYRETTEPPPCPLRALELRRAETVPGF